MGGVNYADHLSIAEDRKESSAHKEAGEGVTKEEEAEEKRKTKKSQINNPKNTKHTTIVTTYIHVAMDFFIVVSKAYL